MSVGLAPTAISNYIASGSIPRADIALKIARAVGVPLDWLIDDSQDFPPPMPLGSEAESPAVTPEECARKIVHPAAATLHGDALFAALRGASEGLSMHDNSEGKA